MRWARTTPCCWMNSREKFSGNAKNWLKRTINDSSLLPTIAVPVPGHVFRGPYAGLGYRTEYVGSGVAGGRKHETAVVVEVAFRTSHRAGIAELVYGRGFLCSELLMVGAPYYRRARRLALLNGGVARSVRVGRRDRARHECCCADRTLCRPHTVRQHRPCRRRSGERRYRDYGYGGSNAA